MHFILFSNPLFGGDALIARQTSMMIARLQRIGPCQRNVSLWFVRRMDAPLMISSVASKFMAITPLRGKTLSVNSGRPMQAAALTRSAATAS